MSAISYVCKQQNLPFILEEIFTKIWDVNVSISCALLKYLEIIYVYESEIIRNQLIGYLMLHIGYWKFGNSQSISQLFY